MFGCFFPTMTWILIGELVLSLLSLYWKLFNIDSTNDCKGSTKDNTS